MWFFIVVIFLLALSVASFSNSLIWRLANNFSLKGRSICPKCKEKIAWFDNIPLISFIILKRKCRNCKEKISYQYFLVELFVAILFLFAFFKALDFQYLSFLDFWSQITNSNIIWVLLRDFLAIFLLTIIFVFDLRYYLIPVNLLIIISPFFWLFNVLIGVVWYLPLIFALSLIIFFLFQYLITKGKGIGEGDIWLGASLGLLFSTWNQLLVAVILAYFIGSLVAIFLLIVGKKKWQSKLPLGVFLSLAAIISLFYGDKLWQIYLNIFI